MPKYVHRHTLFADDPNLNPSGSERAQIVRAGFALASLAHAGESRQKINPTIDYIAHPITTYDILTELGETDPALLAAAFLHDTLELDAYRGEPERLQRELEVALEKEGIAAHRATALADEIYGLVYEVTNPKVFGKNKELYQIDRVANMSFDAKKLKIADQAASLICNLLLENDAEEISYDKERAFKEKAATLCHAIIASVQNNPEQRQAMEPYDAFFHRTLRQADKLFLPPKSSARDILRQRMRTRHHFDFYELFTGPITSMLRPPSAIAEKLYLYDLHALPDELESGRPLGLIRVDYDERGCVVKYYLHVSPDSALQNEATRMQQDLTREIREKLRWSGAYGESGKDVVQQGMLRPGNLAAEENVRVYHLHPRMRHDAFAAAVRNAGVCSRADAQLIAKTGTSLLREHDRAAGIRQH